MLLPYLMSRLCLYMFQFYHPKTTHNEVKRYSKPFSSQENSQSSPLLLKPKICCFIKIWPLTILHSLSFFMRINFLISIKSSDLDLSLLLKISPDGNSGWLANGKRYVVKFLIKQKKLTREKRAPAHQSTLTHNRKTCSRVYFLTRV